MLLGKSESCGFLLEPGACVRGKPAIAGGEIDLRDEDAVVVIQRRTEALQDVRGIELRLHEPGRLQNPKLILEGFDLGFDPLVVLVGFVKIVGDDVECGKDCHVRRRWLLLCLIVWWSPVGRRERSLARSRRR